MSAGSGRFARGKKRAANEAPDLNQFFTAPQVARRIVEWANVPTGGHVLEPSAGDGAFVRALPKGVSVTAVELDPCMVLKLQAIKRPRLLVESGDFLGFELLGADSFDLAITNPPYGEGRDGTHLLHALKTSRRVVALVRANVIHGSRRFERLWQHAVLTRRAILVHRPPFYGPGDIGHTAQSDYEAIEFVRLPEGSPRLPVPVWTEFWEDDWV